MDNKKLKVAIVTIISGNIGNRLQNFALQEVLKEMGLDVRTLPLKSTNVILKLKNSVKLDLKILYNKLSKNDKKTVWWERFNRKKIRWSKYSASDKNVSDEYNFFVAGSDQIWNPYFKFNTEREFLNFTNKEKRIAYAASFGVEDIPEGSKEKYSELLKEFSSISVREFAAVKIVDNLTQKKVPVVLDPTMLLGREAWHEFAKKSLLKFEKPYIFKYFLGIRNDEYETYIDNLARENGWEVIDIIKAPNSYKYKIGPMEFVYLLEHSQVVVTDSFHGSVFSILFHKPFMVFERPCEEGEAIMSSRLDTLLTIFKLEEQRINCIDKLSQVTEYEYAHVESILSKERKRAIDFLKKAFKIE